MKGFIITASLFLIMILIIIFNSLFIKATTLNMAEDVKSLNEIPCQENEIIIENIESNWKKASFWIGLSVSHNNIEEVTDMIDSLRAANTANDIEQFQIHVGLLLNSIDEVGRLEKLRINNIL